jgi:hypothetical protein
MEGSFQPCSPVPPFTWSRLKTRPSATPALRAAGFAPEASTVRRLFVSSSLCTPLFHSLPAVISFLEHLILCSRVASPSLHSFTPPARPGCPLLILHRRFPAEKASWVTATTPSPLQSNLIDLHFHPKPADLVSSGSQCAKKRSTIDPTNWIRCDL